MEFDIYYNNKYFLGIITISNIKKYGIISDKKSFNLLIKIEKKGYSLNQLWIKKDDIFLNLVKVVNAYIYILNRKKSEYIEHNPNSKIISSQNCFWTTVEVEYKIDILSKNFCGFSLIKNKTVGQYNFSSIDLGCSFERYKILRYKKKSNYLAILGKSNWRKPMAIKYKKRLAGEILTRLVKIIPYNDINFKKAVKEIMGVDYSSVNVINLPAFYQKISRVVCINQKYGFVFGVSYRIAKTLIKEIATFNQIEVEYWSQILKKDKLNKGIEQKNKINQSFICLVSTISNFLKDNNIDYEITGDTKHDWIKKIYQNKR